MSEPHKGPSDCNGTLYCTNTEIGCAKCGRVYVDRATETDACAYLAGRLISRRAGAQLANEVSNAIRKSGARGTDESGWGSSVPWYGPPICKKMIEAYVAKLRKEGQ